MNSPNKRFLFEGAQPEDGQEILQILEESDFQGEISLIYTRRPDPYSSLLLEGDEVEVIVCRDLEEDGRVVGFGACAFNHHYVNGQPEKVGYLFALRLRKEYQKEFRLLHQGYAYLKQLLRKYKVQYYLTTILEENTYAQQLLEKKRKRSPVPWYEPLGGYEVYSLKAYWRDYLSPGRRGKLGRLRQLSGNGPDKVDKSIPGKEDGGGERRVILRQVTQADLPKLSQFYQQVGPTQNFFPVIEVEDLLTGKLPGPNYDQFYILYDEEQQEILACGACWDQKEYKQYVVKGYGGLFKIIRPLSGVFSLVGYPALPPVGSTLNFFTLSYWAVQDQNLEYFATFIRMIARELSHYSYFLIGINQEHPLRRVLQQRPHLVYKSKVYLVNWEKTENYREEIAEDWPWYLECGRL